MATVNIQTVGGFAALALALAASLMYLRAILVNRTRPHRVSWATWTLIGVLGSKSTLDAGGGRGAYASLVYVGLTATVFALSLMPGVGKPQAERVTDWGLAIFAAGALGASVAAHTSPSIGATVAWTADALAAWPTLRESWRQPEYEAIRPWLVGFLGSLVALGALGNYTYATVAYPAYLASVQLAVTGVLFWGRARIGVSRRH